jgi:hypothetical protein
MRLLTDWAIFLANVAAVYLLWAGVVGVGGWVKDEVPRRFELLAYRLGLTQRKPWGTR